MNDSPPNDCHRNGCGCHAARTKKQSRALRPRAAVVIGGLALVLGVWVFRQPLLDRIRTTATLANDAPSEEVVADMIEQATEPRVALLAAWNSGKIVHRQAAIRSLNRVAPLAEPLPPELDVLLLSAALDTDLNVREAALGQLRTRNHQALAALSVEQFPDPDPQVRLLGLNSLKYLDAAVGLPTVIPLLDDSDPMVVTSTLKAIERWSGEDFGVKLRDTAALINSKTGLNEYREGSHEKAQEGAARARAWWQAQRGDYPPPQLRVPDEARAAARPVPAPDFELPTLEGRRVRLSSLRGKVVLINFWTTWCTACVSEMPELIALQKKHGDQLAILGVSLDFVPDSHGHIGGHAAVEEAAHGDGDHDDHERAAAALKRVREKVARTVKVRGINYTILLDEWNTVGGRYNGGELPTTVIVDAKGYVRRRFVGARSQLVFEAMIAEASRPPAPHAR